MLSQFAQLIVVFLHRRSLVGIANKQAMNSLQVALPLILFVLVSVLLNFFAPGVAAQALYQGKTIRIIVPGAPGGGLDVYSRVLAQNMGKHIPGGATVLVENRSGGVLAEINEFYKNAKPDGQTVFTIPGGFIRDQVLGVTGIRFDGRSLKWLGAQTVNHPVCVLTRTSGIDSVERWKATNKPPRLGATGPASETSIVPRVLQTAIGLRNTLKGFPNLASIREAAERQEVDGICTSWRSVKTVWESALQQRSAVIVLQATLEKHPELPNVPLAREFATSNAAADLLKFGISDPAMISQSYALPPATPATYVETLQKAFAVTVKDPSYIAQARQARLEIASISGVEVQRIVDGLFRVNPSTILDASKLLK
jgi:tripartite-type tricarboxylate transporter receptor subunit TctC